MAKSNWQEGNVVQIPLENGNYGYGIVVQKPLVAFFDFQSSGDPDLELIITQPVAFRIFVHRSAIGKNGWKVIGNVPLPHSLAEEPEFYRFDLLSKGFSIWKAGEERPATEAECVNLECVAVWEKLHIESRLNDHFAGRKNKWVESLSALMRTRKKLTD